MVKFSRNITLAIIDKDQMSSIFLPNDKSITNLPLDSELMSKIIEMIESILYISTRYSLVSIT